MPKDDFRNNSHKQPTSSPSSFWNGILGNRQTIFVLLFGATGCLGLPLLWMSPVFSTTEKLVWSIVNTLYTLALLGMVAATLYWCYLQFRDAGLV